jgi:hypothetical protein
MAEQAKARVVAAALALTTVGLLLGAGGLSGTLLAAPGASPAAEDVQARFKQATDGVFLPNHGQWPDEARFAWRGAGSAIWFAPTRIMYSIVESNTKRRTTPDAALVRPASHEETPLRTHNVEVAFLGANPDLEPVGGDRLEVEYNWLVGDMKVTGVHPFRRITYQGLWHGIDLQFHGSPGSGGAVESVFVVHPDAKAAQIRLRYAGQDRLSLDEKGNLVVATPLGNIVESAPIAYTESGSQVKVAYRFEDDTVSFLVGNYDTSEALYIDPVVVFARQYGGSGAEYTNLGLAEDATSRYVSGYTASTSWSGVPGGGVQTSHAGGTYDWYICKFNLVNDTMTAFTFIGSTSTEYGPGELILAPNGDLMFAGTTYSSDPIGGTAQTIPVNSSSSTTPRAVVVRINSALSSITSVAALGGNSSTYGGALWTNATTGDVYVGGTTCSTSGLGPAASGYQSTNASSGCYEGWITRLDSTMTTALNTTFLGGSYYDNVAAIRTDAAGDVYAMGGTWSGTSYSWPFATTTIGPLSTGGTTDFMLAKLNSSLTGIGSGWSTYVTRVGGTGYDGCLYPYIYTSFTYPTSAYYAASWHAMEIDSTGRMFFAGVSTSTDYPTAGNPFQPNSEGSYDNVVSILNAAGGALEESTYVGGTSTEYGIGDLALAQDGSVVVTGQAYSSDYPTINVPAAPGAVCNPSYGSMVLTQFDGAADLSTLIASMCYSGTYYSWGLSVVSGPGAYQHRFGGGVYSQSTGDWPSVPSGAPIFGGGGGTFDGVVVSIDLRPDLVITKTAAARPDTYWLITVANNGAGRAAFTSGQRILLDNLPAAGYGTPTVQNPINITGVANIACSIVGNDLTCTASGATVSIGGAGSFEVRVPFAWAVTNLTNPRDGGVCAADPDDHIDDPVASNNVAAAATWDTWEIPALGPWGIAALVTLLVAAGLIMLRRTTA